MAASGMRNSAAKTLFSWAMAPASSNLAGRSVVTSEDLLEDAQSRGQLVLRGDKRRQEAQRVLANLNGIEFVYFTEKDVVRHKLVQMIIKAYEEHSNHKNHM